MISKWFKLKEKAIKMRRAGNSLRDVSLALSIPKSTLSGWFKDIKLSAKHQKALDKRHADALVKARKSAAIVNKHQKVQRLKLAELEANKVIQSIDLSNNGITEIALALLYLGEGFKKSETTGMGNSDPEILKFFLSTMLNIYNLDINKIRFNLHLRADQDQDAMKKYWSKTLEVPIDRFGYVIKDKRTQNSKTYSKYKGVCVINCGNVAIQRKLVYIGRKFCDKVVNNMRD
jgi:hypothetical protein